MLADMTVAWKDLPAEEKEFFGHLRCVYDWKVGLPFLSRQAAKGKPGAAKKVAKRDAVMPSVERPFVRPHPVTKEMAIMGDPAFVSHIVGRSREESKEVLRRAMRLCEVPEYQLRIPWLAEGDCLIFDNYVLKHRIVADFKGIPPQSRTLDNILSKGYPSEQNKVLAGVEVDHTRFFKNQGKAFRADLGPDAGNAK